MSATAPDEEPPGGGIGTPAEDTDAGAGAGGPGKEKKKKKEKKSRKKSKASGVSGGESEVEVAVEEGSPRSKKEKKSARKAKKASAATNASDTEDAGGGGSGSGEKKKKKRRAKVQEPGGVASDAEAVAPALPGPARPGSGPRSVRRTPTPPGSRGGSRPVSPGDKDSYTTPGFEPLPFETPRTLGAPGGQLGGSRRSLGRLSLRARVQRGSRKSMGALGEAQKAIDSALADNEKASTEFMANTQTTAPLTGTVTGTVGTGSQSTISQGGRAPSMWGSFGATARSLGQSFYATTNRVLNKGSDILAKILGEDQPEDAVIECESEFEAPVDQEQSDGIQPLAERGYNLRRVRYRDTEITREYDDDSYWVLQSGQPFPSYHTNPTRDAHPRFFDVPNAKPPIEDIHAPRIRLAPHELEKRAKHIEAIKIKALEENRVAPVEVLNLSYQDLGDKYQMEQLTAFLDVNRGVRRLALTDNQIDDVSHLLLEHCVKLYLSRNMIITWAALPPLPACEELYVTRNFIGNTQGLSSDKFPKLRKLYLRGNPLCRQDDYLESVRDALPDLTHLDGQDVDNYVRDDQAAA